MIDRRDHVLEWVDDYLHDLLHAADVVTLEEHCRNCPICGVALEEARRRFAIVSNVPPAQASEKLVSRALSNLDKLAVQRNVTRFPMAFNLAYIIVTGALILATIHWFVYRLNPSPYDLRIMGQRDLFAGSRAALRLAVFHRHSGKMQPGIPVDIHLLNASTKERALLAQLNTSEFFDDSTPSNAAQPIAPEQAPHAKGAETAKHTFRSTQFIVPDWKPGNYELQVTATTSDGLEVIRQPVQLKRKWNILLSTDKPVYQPGQSILMRVLALRQSDLRPISGESAEFALFDPRGNIIFRSRGPTSRFGIVSAECPLHTELAEGSYRVECKLGETTTNRTIEVQTYVLPKFKVAAELTEPFYMPGDTLRGKLNAVYFFGKPVAHAKASLEFRTLDVPGPPLATLQLETDEMGVATFEFPIPQSLVGSEQNSGLASVRVNATVVDTAGQSNACQATVPVSSAPLLLDVLPENGALVSGVPNTIYIIARYPDGSPASVRLSISGHSPERSTNELGVAEFSLTPSNHTEKLLIKASDAKGVSSQREVKLVCGNFSDDFLLRSDKAVYNGGDVVTLTALGAGIEPVFIDVLKDGQTILTETLDIEQGHGELAFGLPENAFGTLELVAYRFGSQGLPVRKRRALYVRQPNAIRLTASLDRDEYRPGGKAKLNISLRNEKDQPTPGAVSLVAVDEAVFSVANRSGLDPTMAMLEQQLLNPIYAIYDRWTPEPPDNRDSVARLRLERAVFSATASTLCNDNAIPAPFAGRQPLFSEIEFTSGSQDLYSLAGASFPSKERAVTIRRARALKFVNVGWAGLALATLLGGWVAILSVYRYVGLALGAILLGGVVVLSLPPIRSMPNRAPVKSAGVALDAAEKAPEPASGPTKNDTAKSPSLVSNPPDPSAPSTLPRLRRDFPETLLWRPEIVTDDSGAVTVDIDLADSITTWRLSASAVSSRGKIGAAQWPLKVFQPFFVDLNLPPTLTRNDEVDVPAVVYNYSTKEMDVELELQREDWFELRSSKNGESPALVHTLHVEPGQVRSFAFPLRVKKAGSQRLILTARGDSISDMVEREIEIMPDGRRAGELVNGTLDPVVVHEIAVPINAIESSVRTILKIYPSPLSQLTEGLDAIFKMPSGCFEQTSSTTYPNVLALDFLKRQKTRKSPAIEAKARQFIHLGYQRLLTFEVPGGGFDWFGQGPGKLKLSAYGLMQFNDMSRVYNIDTQVMTRTRNWLLSQRSADGSWSETQRAGGRPADDQLLCTAYIAWAVFDHQDAKSQSEPTLKFLLGHKPDSIDSPYALALVASAIASIDRNHDALPGYLSRLDKLKKTNADGKLVWWESPPNHETVFYGSGRAGNIETTAQAAQVFFTSDTHYHTARKALAWLNSQRDPRGTWHSTQATVLTLKALLAGNEISLNEEAQRDIEVQVNGQLRHKIIMHAADFDVVRTIDLSDELTSGKNQIRIEDNNSRNTRYQLYHRYHLPDAPPAPANEPFTIDIQYDRTRLGVDEHIQATATLKNNLPRAAPMVILDLPIPGGFTLERDEFDELVGSKTIDRYQLSPRKAIVYLREIPPAGALELRYRLKATMPVKTTLSGAQAYLYYSPEVGAQSSPTTLEVVSAEKESIESPPDAPKSPDKPAPEKNVRPEKDADIPANP